MRKTLATLLCAAALFAADAPRRAPGFSLVDSRQQLHDLADFRGKPVILEFMQTTCPHCAVFADTLNKVQQKYGDRVAILAIANPPDNPTTVAQYIAGHKITYLVLFDVGQVAYSYVVKPSFDLPQVYLIDAKGMIKNEFAYGPMTRDIFEGNAFLPEVDKLFVGAAAQQKKK